MLMGRSCVHLLVLFVNEKYIYHLLRHRGISDSMESFLKFDRFKRRNHPEHIASKSNWLFGQKYLNGMLDHRDSSNCRARLMLFMEFLSLLVD